MNAHSRPLLPDSAVVSQVTRHGEFARLCRVLLLGGRNNFAPDLGIVRTGSPRLQAAVKAAVGGAGLANNDAAIAYREVGNAWLAALRHASVFDAMLADMKPAPAHQRFSVSTAVLIANQIDEFLGAPVHALSLVAAEPLRPVKVAAICVATRELLRESSAEQLVDAELRAAAAAGTDRVFLAGLIAATTPIPSTGSIGDINALLAAVPLGKQSRPHWVFTPDLAKALTVERDASGARTWPDISPLGGEIYGWPVEVSDQLAAGAGLLVDAAGIAANGGEVDVDVSGEASVEMTDAPTQDGRAGTGAASLSSLWQLNQAGIKVTRAFGFQILRPEAVAAVSGIAWGSAP